MACNKLIRAAVGADYAHEHIDPGIRMGDSTVMLSAAKHLAAHRVRPFASLRACPERSEWGDSGGPIYRPRRIYRNPV
jgi:hypothetical protein